jgi:hypothetical protein
VGGLSHYIEDEGIATTHISLIREHTETINPPRALWVPFELGRPLGVPNDPAFQKKVLLSALKLLETNTGPVLSDYMEDAPGIEAGSQAMACPVNFQQPTAALSSTEALLGAFQLEAAQLQTWYDLVLEKTGRTTAGLTGWTPAETVRFIAAFVRGERPEHNLPGNKLSTALRMAVEDLKTYYLESISSQPAQPTDSATLSNWFWGETHAAGVINRIRLTCLESKEKEMNILGSLLLIPRNQLHRFGN